MKPQSRGASLTCWVYRSRRQDEMYLYVAREGDFGPVPKSLMARFGTPEFVMELPLHPGRRLAREEVGRVMENLQVNGFHLQMPPEIRPKMYEGE